MSVDKLILGTAGLGGLPYGRSQRVVSVDDACELIKHALYCGITSFDTAPAYGFAENALGSTCRMLGKSPRVFTKTKGDRSEAVTSLYRLKGTDRLFLWHNWDESPRALPRWVSGVTAYDHEADHQWMQWLATLQESDEELYYQIGWNLFNQYPLRPKRALVIARSVFLQGVLAYDKAPNKQIEDHVMVADRMASVYGVDLPTLALRAALELPNLHGVVIGPTTIDELDTCIGIANRKPLNVGPVLDLLDLGREATDPRKWAA